MSDEIKQEAEKLIYKTKIKLQGSDPFFAYLLMQMGARADVSIPTLAVDIHGNLFYSPEYVCQLSRDELKSALVHETMHIVLSHMKRKHKDWDHQLMNIAADIIVNDLLITEGFSMRNEWILPYNHEFTFTGKDGLPVCITNVNKKTMEEVYNLLYDNAPEQNCPMCNGTGKADPQEGAGGSGGGGSSDGDKQEQDKEGAGGDSGSSDGDKQEEGAGTGSCPACGGKGSRRFIPGFTAQDDIRQPSEDELTADQEEALAKEWRFRTAEAMSTAKQCGKLSGNLQSRLGDLFEPKVNWRDKLIKFISERIPFDATWARPSKRSMAAGYYAPSYLKENLEVVVHVDTSGSISSQALSDFMSEIKGILESFSQVKMDLLLCDYNIAEHIVLTAEKADKVADIIMKGGGGTSHRPVVQWVNENKPETHVLISLTDGYSDIQNCYDDLPGNCARLLVMENNWCRDYSLEQYGEIIELN